MDHLSSQLMQDYCCCSHCFFNLQRNRLFTSMPLGNNAGTEIRTRLQLRSTVRGANNRLDVDAIMSYDRGSNAARSPRSSLRDWLKRTRTFRRHYPKRS